MFTSAPFSFAGLAELIASVKSGVASLAVTGAALHRILKHGGAAPGVNADDALKSLCLNVRLVVHLRGVHVVLVCMCVRSLCHTCVHRACNTVVLRLHITVCRVTDPLSTRCAVAV